MLNSARETPFFLDKSWQVWAANRRPPKADQRAISTSSRPARVRRPPASGEEARQMRLRTPAIRRDRPTVRGSPALRARSTSAGLVPAELSAKNHPCDAKDHARPRKYLEQTASQNGVFKEPNVDGAPLRALLVRDTNLIDLVAGEAGSRPGPVRMSASDLPGTITIDRVPILLDDIDGEISAHPSEQ